MSNDTFEHEILTVNISGDDEQLCKEFLDYLRKFPGRVTDNAKIAPDTRRGGFTTRYATFVISH